MPLASTDVGFFLSGGGANSDPNASLGGVISSTQITSGALNNLFDDVSSAEALAGDVEYRCIYVQNIYSGSPEIVAENISLFVQTLSPSTDTSFAIGVAAEGANVTAETIANESSAPVGNSPNVEFFESSASPHALALGNLSPGEWIGVWIRRTVSAAASAYTNDGPTLRATFDTAG